MVGRESLNDRYTTCEQRGPHGFFLMVGGPDFYGLVDPGRQDQRPPWRQRFPESLYSMRERFSESSPRSRPI